MIPARAAIAALLVAVLGGCSSVKGTAIRTGPMRLAPRGGPVAIYLMGHAPAGSDLGVVEVHAQQTEANVETLLPVFASKVASLGGNAAVVEGVVADFAIVQYLHVESYSYPCGRYTCVGTRSYPVTQEVMTLSMRGRAMLTPGAAGQPVPPAGVR